MGSSQTFFGTRNSRHRHHFCQRHTPDAVDHQLVVLDTNVLIGALQAKMYPKRVEKDKTLLFGRACWLRIKNNKAKLCFSRFIRDEIWSRCGELGIHPSIINQFVLEVEKLAACNIKSPKVIAVKSGEISGRVCKSDPDDVGVVSTALLGRPRRASQIITNDGDFIDEVECEGVRIIHAAYFAGYSKYPGRLPPGVSPSQAFSPPPPGF